MTASLTDEQIARVLLAAVSEPGDGVTGTLLRSLGASETVRLIKTRKPLPDAIDNTDGALWRDRLRARLRDADLDRVLADTERRGLTIITPDDSRWPTELRELGAHAPIALWIAGNCSSLAAHTSRRVAIVGARAATSYGEHAATELASELAGSGVNVVSGGAYGIDGAAHRAAISARPAATVAVLAGGLDRPYPAGHANLFDRIIESGGALIGELPPGAAPTKWRFMQRNRLLAALGGATVVVEAGSRSGSLDIAIRAHTLGRPVGAVPGPVTSAASTGCHRLLRERIATVVTNACEVRELLEPAAPPAQNVFDRASLPATRRRAMGLAL